MTGPRVIDFRDATRAADTLDSVLDHLKRGGLLAYPTETVYGFGGLPIQAVIKRLLALKKREPAKPMLLLVQDGESVSDLTWTPEALELADVFWPGSITLVLSDPEARYPEGVRGSDGGVAVRVSPHPLVRELVSGVGGPLVINQCQSARGGSSPGCSGCPRRCSRGRGGRGFVGARRGSPGALSAVHDHRLLGARARGSTRGRNSPRAGSPRTSWCP